MITKEAHTIEAIPKNGKNGSIYKKVELEPRALPKKEKSYSSRVNIKHEIKVFLVDDDEFFLNGLYYYLTDSLHPKIKVEVFSTAEECLSAMHKNPEIIVVDYMLNTGSSKTMNGLSALKKINQLSPTTFVIMLSAQDNIDVALEALNEGAYDYLSKSETAFLRLKNMIKNIAETISENREQEKAEIATKRLNLFVILLLFLLFIISQIIK